MYNLLYIQTLYFGKTIYLTDSGSWSVSYVMAIVITQELGRLTYRKQFLIGHCTCRCELRPQSDKSVSQSKSAPSSFIVFSATGSFIMNNTLHDHNRTTRCLVLQRTQISKNTIMRFLRVSVYTWSTETAVPERAAQSGQRRASAVLLNNNNSKVYWQNQR